MPTKKKPTTAAPKRAPKPKPEPKRSQASYRLKIRTVDGALLESAHPDADPLQTFALQMLTSWWPKPSATMPVATRAETEAEINPDLRAFGRAVHDFYEATARYFERTDGQAGEAS
jgi:hypothetical protein